MTNTKIKRKIMKGAMLVVVLFMLVGGVVSHALTTVSMEQKSSYNSNFFFDYKEVLTAPTKVNTGDGVYYVPTAYVYYGRRYDSANQSYVSLLNRVLDPNADNAGNSGAMFLLAEETAYSSRFSPYADDTTADYLVNENSYIASYLVQKVYSGKYTVYDIAYVNTSSEESLPQELDYIRPITKADVSANMDGYFGFTKGNSEYFWSVVDKDGKSVESLELLNGARAFPLSAEELYRYVGDRVFTNNKSAQALFVATDVLDGTPRSWWLRSALGDGAGTGRMVGAVDTDGKVTYISAQKTLATRNAFNIETSEIAFVERVADNTYRLAFNAPEYKEGAPLEAAITDVKGNKVTCTVKNHIGNSTWEHAGESRISYVITDSDGNEKYYGTAGKVRSSSLVGERVADEESFSITLPECYVQGDKVQVFWERVQDPDRISTSFVSNFADLGCIHVPEEGMEANCQGPAICAICDLPYGAYNPDYHRDVATVWIYNEDEGTHSRTCIQCGEKVYTEPCSFGPTDSTEPYACYVSACNGCGHKVDHPSLHNYDENGICRSVEGEYHYEMPEIINNSNTGFETRISTAGQWNALARWLNDGGYLLHLGELKYVVIDGDLDFDGIPFVPMGTEELPVKNLDIQGHHHRFTNIEYNAPDNAPAGIIAVGENIDIDNMIVQDCSFSGSDVGGVVGRLVDKADNSSDFNGIFLGEVRLNGTNAGGIVGTLSASSTLSFAFIYEVTHGDRHTDFSSDGKLIPTPATVDNGVPRGGCYRLVAEGDADGEFAFEYDAFNSGEITYRLRQIDPYWKQTLGADFYPEYCEDESVKRVYRVVSCDGSKVFYSNEDIGQIQHGEYTSVVPGSFEWVDGVGDFGVGFKVDVVCGLCEKPTEVVRESRWSVYYSHNSSFIARMEFNAYLEIDGEEIKVNDEPKVVYTNKLNDLIGMTPITVKYNGNDQYTDPLFNNLRDGLIYQKDFDAFFLDPATGKRITHIEYDYYGKPVEIPAGVKNVGVYDVLIVGKGGYKGYEYLYEDVFTIEKAKVTVIPQDVRKFYDGSKEFEVEYKLEGDQVWDLKFDISLESAPDSKIGRYTLKVNADLDSHRHGDNLELVLAEDTVTALILPDLTIAITNKSYPTTITYGDPIPEVKTEHFNVSADAVLSYQWFTAGYNYYDGYYAERAVDAPTNAGVYILRVTAADKEGNLISSTLDLEVEITKRSLTVDLYAPKDVEVLEGAYGSYYVLDHDEAFTYEINGFVNGDTMESLGLKLSIYLSSAEGAGSPEGDRYSNPSIPFDGGYRMEYNLSESDNYLVGKYVIHVGTKATDSEYGVVYISIRNPGYIYPVDTEFVADGEAISPNLLISAFPPQGISGNGEFDYTIKVYNSSGTEILSKTSSDASLEKLYLYEHTYYASWNYGHTVTRGAFSNEGEYRVTVVISGEGVSTSYETTFTLQFFNSQGEGVNKIIEPGLYRVKVINEDGSVYESALYAQQKLTMNLKPHEYNISEGRVEYDPTKVIMEAGQVIHLNHTLAEVYFNVNESTGKIYVDGVKVLDKDGNDVSRLYAVEYSTTSWPSHSDSLNVCHIFDNPCDHSCNIEDCDYVRAVAHSGGTATCSRKAICKNCGIEYGEYAYDNHVSSDFIVYPNVSSPDDSHLYVYVCCGRTKAVVQHTHKSPATCTQRAVCAECGWEYGELDPTNHSSTDKTYVNEGESHKVTHHCCGAVETESHQGGTAYCNAKAVCALCSGAYGLIDPENHAEEHRYVPDENDENRHIEIYPCCEKSTSYTHSGGDATCVSRMVCDYCHAEYGELEPDDHASDALAYRQDMDNPSLHTIHHACCDLYIDKEHHEGGEANCQSPAICSSCGTPYGDKDYRNHASDEYSCYPDSENGEVHVKVAACCGEFAEKEQHSFGEPDCIHAARCVCGAEIGEPIEHSYDNDCDSVCNLCGEQTRAESFHVGKDGKPCEVCGEIIPKESMSGSGISAIVTASTVATSAGGFSLFWFVIKKKSLAELLKLLLK